MENNTNRFKIEVDIDRSAIAKMQGTTAQFANADGYSIHDYFTCDLDATYDTQDAAESAAQANYKGADIDGVGCKWKIVAVESE